MTSYRQSHVGKDYGEHYDAKFVNRVDSLVWDNFTKPFVRQELERVAETGAKTYLDFACGTGRLLKVGHTVFGNSVGVDISKDMLAEARRRVPDAKLVCADVTRQEASDLGAFECVTMFRFLRNAEPELRQGVMDWLSRHVAKGGTLIVNDHGNSASVGGLVTRLAFWLTPSARNLRSRRQTVQILRDAGFSIVRCEGFQILPSIFGRPILGRWLQVRAERICRSLGLGRFGMELIIVARRT